MDEQIGRNLPYSLEAEQAVLVTFFLKYSVFSKKLLLAWSEAAFEDARSYFWRCHSLPFILSSATAYKMTNRASGSAGMRESIVTSRGNAVIFGFFIATSIKITIFVTRNRMHSA